MAITLPRHLRTAAVAAITRRARAATTVTALLEAPTLAGVRTVDRILGAAEIALARIRERIEAVHPPTAAVVAVIDPNSAIRLDTQAVEIELPMLARTPVLLR